MSRTWAVFITFAGLLFLISCGSDDGGPTGSSNKVPATVTDLAVTILGDSTVSLTWTAPSDPGKALVVSAYDLRYATTTITDATWDGASQAAEEPTPGASGAPETFTVEGLDLGTSYSFAIKSIDDENAASGLSNVVSATTDSIDDRLIAYYPLVDDSADVTGMNDPMSLLNTPFQNGGIYCNGVSVSGSDPNPSNAETPTIDSLDFGGFTIRVRFQPEWADTVFYNPVIVGGGSYRWMDLRLLPDSTVGLMYNGGGVATGTARYAPGTWYEGTITYDGTTGRLYLDDTLAAEATFTLTHGDDRNLGITNYSNGTVYYGTLGWLKIYDGVVTP